MKSAVILFNLGGPDKLESVEPFLFNLFNDPAIISIPSLFRYPLAKFISKRRTPIAKNIYKEIGNKSPILEFTQDQAKSLENNLKKEENDLLAKKSVLSKEEYTKKSDSLRKKVIDYQSKRRSSLDKITAQRAKAREDLIKALDPIIQKYISEYGISMIID